MKNKREDSYENKTKCVECVYCKCTGRAKSQCGILGRKEYFCSHPKSKNMSDKHGFPLFPFVGFGSYKTVESSLALKTQKKWCPTSGKIRIIRVFPACLNCRQISFF